MKRIAEGIFENERRLFTLNSSGSNFFNDDIIRQENNEYRQWDATRSKLAAAIAKGLKAIPIDGGSRILYLGAAHGYTVSHLAAICGKGRITAVEFAPRVARELILIAEKIGNILPIVKDANAPESYYHLAEAADVVYQDIAQRNQVQIFLRNCRLFLKKGGYGMLAIKARSMDVTRKPGEIFAEAKRQLEQEMQVIDYRNLEPFQKSHAFFVCRKK